MEPSVQIDDLHKDITELQAVLDSHITRESNKKFLQERNYELTQKKAMLEAQIPKKAP